jgi:hypothetical protein
MKFVLTMVMVLGSAMAFADSSTKVNCYSKDVIAPVILEILKKQNFDGILYSSTLKTSLNPEGVGGSAAPLVAVIDVAFKNSETGKYDRNTYVAQFLAFDYATCTPSKYAGLGILW